MPIKPASSQNVSSLPESISERVGFAVVGLGKLTAEQLIPAIRGSKHARLAALVTGDAGKGAALAEANGLSAGDVYTYDDFETLAEREDVQAVFIVLPNNLHRDFTERAAKMGKHVLCEKPLATNAADARAMVEACKGAGVLLMTAYRCQYTPEHWAMREAVQGGHLGAIRSLDSYHSHRETDGEQWRMRADMAGGGPLMDVGIYCLNTIRFVLGKEPLWVFADAHRPTDDPRFAEVEERMSWMMGFEGGVVATCHSSYASQPTSTLRVVGEKGKADLEPAFNYGGLRLTFTEGPHERACIRRYPYYDQFGNEVDHFAECIRTGRTPWTAGEEGVADHRVLEAIYQSARTGQRVLLGCVEGLDTSRGELKPRRPE